MKKAFIVLVILISVSINLLAQQIWLDSDIGYPSVTGSHTESNGMLTITGAGTGEKQSGDDQMHFTYINYEDGDIDIIARITSFDGSKGGTAGIMLRTNNNASSSSTAMNTFKFKAANDDSHYFVILGRDEASGTNFFSAEGTKMVLPIWLRLTRRGKYFAVYKSNNGKLWSSLGDNSGWEFNVEGVFEAGFYVSSGTSNETASVTLDNVSIEKPHLGYTTSWIGNTFGGNALDGHVSGGVSSMYTTADGTCYTNSPYDEGGQTINIYKDGKSIGGGRNWGNSSAYEGSITSDGKNLYLAFDHFLYKSDMMQNIDSRKQIFLSIDPYENSKGSTIISGMTFSNQKLYLSDARENKIRVVDTSSFPNYLHRGLYGDMVNITSHAIDTQGVLNAAPPEVYQSQRYNEYVIYDIPVNNLDPNKAYTLRCHFAEYKETQIGKRLIDIGTTGADLIKNFDVIAAAGGPFRAAVLDIPNARFSDGIMRAWIQRSEGGDGAVVICALEVIDNGKQVFAVNCGGKQVGNFQREIFEQTDLAFPFERPGPMVADKRGDLWIIKEANDFPILLTNTTKYKGLIQCYHPDGVFTGKEIEVENPTAIAYDAVNDRLLITDNGANQNIRIYNNLEGSVPTYVGSFGEQHGLFNGPNPGLINDEEGVGSKRFYGLSGVGIDTSGNIYVACTANGTDIRKYTPDGQLVWMSNAIPFCNTASIDPASDGKEVYAPYWHAKMDLKKTDPGTEWKYTAYNWDASKYGPAPRPGSSQAMMRRVGDAQKLIMYTSSQGSAEYVGIFRYDHEIIIPCGQIRGNGTDVWIDFNGDGKETSEEVSVIGNGYYLSRFDVDQKGDIWLVLLKYDEPVLRHFKMKGLTADGAPIYGTGSEDFEDIPFPGLGKKVSTWSQFANAKYDAKNDVMYLMGPVNERTETDQEYVISYLARYNDWSKGNRNALWLDTLPDPGTDFNFTFNWRPYNLPFVWQGFDIAGDKIFIAEIWGPVHVFSTNTGEQEMIMNYGPEVSGSGAWEDAGQGLNAFQCSNGEYIIFTENSGYDGKINMFRIPPVASVISSTQAISKVENSFSVVPNPFVNETSIRYFLEGKSEVNISIFDCSGRLIKKLYQGNQKKGSNEIKWNGTMENGELAVSGIYICRLQMGDLIVVRKISYFK